MKATELMIGDWVRPLRKEIGDKPCRVITIDGGSDLGWIDRNDFSGPVPLSQVERIPLTAEILEKNTDGGFCDFRDPIIGYKGKRSLYWIGKVGIYVEWERMIGVPYVEFQGLGDTFFKGYIKSLHELQHALRLCGIEKEVVL